MHELTIAQAADGIRAGTISAVELMEALLARSRALDPKLRVWETLDEDAALEAARSAQAEIERAGPRGALHGVPIGIKDIFNTKGVRTASGSPIYDDYVPDFDSTAVALLRDAGAVIMGKAVTTEFASFDPSPTRNPWNAEHTPGGSSSGSAAGVASRLFPAALGSQTSGSVLRPASYNGVVGVKPTFGRISRYGVTPVAWSLDTVGYFTRTVRDAAVMLEVLAGRDELDSSSSAKPVSRYSEDAANASAASKPVAASAAVVQAAANRAAPWAWELSDPGIALVKLNQALPWTWERRLARIECAYFAVFIVNRGQQWRRLRVCSHIPAVRNQNGHRGW